jgi:outer membrane receptor protein involved in Fe transport
MKYLPSRKNPAALFAALLVLANWPGRAQTTAPSPTPGQTDPKDSVVTLETFTVTGSNIKRMDVEKVLPITVIDPGAFEIRDAAQPSDLLTALPEITGLPGNETATLGATARGDNASVSLRGIPSSNTLMLLNSRRLAPHPISQSEAGVTTLSTNVNQLPNRGLERVEVLRDGASSIYGTDAVAGVVNYVTKKDLRGTELSLRFSETNYRDGQDYRTTLTHGLDFAKGKGRAVATVDFYHREPMYVRDRPFAAEADNSSRAPAPWNVPTSTTFNFRSATSEYGNYSLGTVTGADAYGTPTFTAGRPTGIPSTLAATSGQFFLAPGANNTVVFMTSTPSRAGVTHDYYWNNNTYRVIQPGSNRTNALVNVEYDLNDRVTVFAEGSLYQAQSITYREPDGITASTDGNIVVPVTNPFNPFGNRFWSPTGAPNTDGTPRLTGTPSAVLISNKRLTDLATRTDYVDSAVYRGVAGLRGKLFRSWNWEAALLYSAARTIENEEGPSRKSLLVQAINQTDSTKTFNPFTRTFAVQGGTLVVTGNYKNPESVLSTFRSSFIRNGITRLGSGDFRASGDLLSLWGGNTLGGAFGGEFRFEAYDDYRPPFAGLNPPGSGLDPAANDFLGFSPNSDTHGKRNVAAAYAEVVAPLVGRKLTYPLVRSLELSASVRYESYTDFGDTTKPKYGLNWRPADWLMVRSSYNEGFRAPNLALLFTGSLIRTATGSNDTYRSPVTGLPTDGPSNRRTVASGNRLLQPETAKGKSAGFVVDVPVVKGLSLSLDYWEIRQKDLIATGGGIADDNEALQAATQAALAAGQNIAAIDLGSGTANYRGDPSVIRLPVTQADRDFFAAYNATRAPGNQRAVVGAIEYIKSTYFNKAEQFVNGFDLGLSYRFPKLALGNFTFNTDWTYLNDHHAYSYPVGDSRRTRTEYRNGNSSNVGGATPIWRGNANLTWRRKAWGAGIGFYYIGRYTDVNATTTQATWDSLGNPSYIKPIFNNGAYSYRWIVQDSKSYNVYVTYRVTSKNRYLDKTDIRLGVNNVLNAEPPLSADSRGYDVAIYNTMARGRVFSLQLTKKL